MVLNARGRVRAQEDELLPALIRVRTVNPNQTSLAGIISLNGLDSDVAHYRTSRIMTQVRNVLPSAKVHSGCLGQKLL